MIFNKSTAALAFSQRTTGFQPVPQSRLNHLEGRALVLLFSVAQASSL